MEATLPAELRSAIVTFCAAETLPSVALVNRELQLLAEKILYASIVIRTFNAQIGALETLAESPQRASWVKFLSVEFYRQDKGSDAAIMGWLISALPSMENLKDLRIKLRPGLRSHADDLGNILYAGHCQLTTLFIDAYFDLRRIVEKHEHLDLLATYGASEPGLPLALLSSVYKRPLIALGLDRAGYRPFYNRLLVLPELLASDQASNFDVLLQAHFDSDAMQSVKPIIDRVADVVIYLRDVPSQEAFSAFMRCIKRAFTGICEMEIHVKCGLVEKAWPLGSLDEYPLAGYEIWNWNIDGDKALDSDLIFRGSKADLLDWVHEQGTG